MSNAKEKSALEEIQAIRRLRQNAEWKRDRWLRSRGWHQTCETPSSYWMWENSWKGKTFLVDPDTAERIQANWDAEQDYNEHPENYED